MADKIITRTERLTLRLPDKSDAASLLQLYNQADFIANIRDKNIRTLEQATEEIEKLILPHYEKHSFCLYAMDYEDERCVGLCGLVKRPELDLPDLGYATRSDFQGLGLTTEACRAVVEHSRDSLGLKTLAAIVNPDNMASITVLNNAGFGFVDGMQLEEDGPMLKYFELATTA